VTQPVLFAVQDGEHSAVAEGGMQLSKSDKGDLSEMLFEIEAMTRGWLVASARGKGRDFDIILKKPQGRPVVVQVKRCGRPKKSNGSTYYINCGRKDYSQGIIPYHKFAFDVLAVHLADTQQFVFFSRQEIGDRTRASFTPPNERKTAPQNRALEPRQPDNWELLDQVAAMYSQESLGVAQPMSHPVSQNLPIP
jgi:hypothetical protein